MFEGVPTYPDIDRFWEIVERHKITHFYTAPTAIRALMRYGDDPVKKHDLGSLKVLGTVLSKFLFFLKQYVIVCIPLII